MTTGVDQRHAFYGWSDRIAWVALTGRSTDSDLEQAIVQLVRGH